MQPTPVSPTGKGSHQINSLKNERNRGHTVAIIIWTKWLADRQAVRKFLILSGRQSRVVAVTDIYVEQKLFFLVLTSYKIRRKFTKQVG